MALYITRAAVSINGPQGSTTVTDFKAVTEKARTIRKPVHLMYKTGAAELTQRYGVELDYVVPRDSAEFNFAEVTGGTLVIDYTDPEASAVAHQVTFGGVHCHTIGDAMVDGEAELVRKVEFICESRNTNDGSTPSPELGM
jgi:hypothetical protein